MFIKVTTLGNKTVYVNEDYIIKFYKTQDYTKFVLTCGAMDIKEEPFAIAQQLRGERK